MCGIIGYNGSKQAKEQILSGLKKIEYRGYDSAGLAVLQPNGKIKVCKTKGGVDELSVKAATLHEGNLGIGHTRWATHGKPNQTNAHPHQTTNFSLVHNGIIENYQELKEQLIGQGYTDFKSDTDTEVLAWLIESSFQKSGNIRNALTDSLAMVRGTFGIALVNKDTPNVLYIARRSSPIVIAKIDTGHLVASDITALPPSTEHATYLGDDQFAVITPDTLSVYDLDHAQINHTTEKIDITATEVSKHGQSHFMLKEILEQPQSVANTLRGRIDENNNTAVLGGLDVTKGYAKKLTNMTAIACGTAYYSSVLASYLLEDVVDIPLHSEMASEFLYRNQTINPKVTMGLAISQSGETADTMAAINKLNMLGVRTHGVVNVVGSNISRITDGGTYLRCGPEIAVASTKAFTSQVVAQVLIGLKLNTLRGEPIKNNQQIIKQLKQLPKALQDTINATHQTIEDTAKATHHYEKVMFLGRNSLYPVALEGALKYKEITYTPSEAHPAGEMKHGPLALVDDDMLIVYLLKEGPLFEKSLSNLQEIKARGGRLIVITDSKKLAQTSGGVILLPKNDSIVAPLSFNIVLQLLAYYSALGKDLNIDKPRNLAKSVTVE